MEYDLEPPSYIDEEQQQQIQQNISKEVRRLQNDPRTYDAIDELEGHHCVVTGYRLYKRLRNFGVTTSTNACAAFLARSFTNDSCFLSHRRNQHKGE